MKIKNTTIILFMSILILSLTSCNSNKKIIDGKYVSIYDKSTYLIFDKDGSVISNMWTVLEDGENIPRDCFQYSIDENNIITAIDTTKYEGQEELKKYEIGIMYKEYICLSWKGTLPNKYEDTSLTRTVEGLNSTCNLKKDRTYEYIVTHDGKVVYNGNGTYLINNGEVICTNDNNINSTFINIDNKTYCIEYIKE